MAIQLVNVLEKAMNDHDTYCQLRNLRDRIDELYSRKPV